jgi:hypothetical protein
MRDQEGKYFSSIRVIRVIRGSLKARPLLYPRYGGVRYSGFEFSSRDPSPVAAGALHIGNRKSSTADYADDTDLMKEEPIPVRYPGNPRHPRSIPKSYSQAGGKKSTFFSRL